MSPRPHRLLTTFPAALVALVLTLAGCASGARSGAGAAPPTPDYYASPDPRLATLPFSEAVRTGDFLFLSGQIGSVPGTMQVASGGIAAEAQQALDNIKGILERHGATMDDVVKCTVFLADMRDWPAFNEVYRKAFTKHFPARSAFGANGLALGARVEVECVAALPAARR
jgi:reactive intermediate/imine deaminase